MKTNTIFLFAFAAMVASCNSFSELKDVQKVEPIAITIKTALNLGNAPAPSSLNVKLINYAENLEYNLKANAQGEVTVNNIIPGVYTITIIKEETHDIYTYYYTGNSVNKTLIENGQKVEITINVAKSGALIFKELFYGGSRTPADGTWFRDQFYEIYNNSEIEINVRNLGIMQLAPLNVSANPPIFPDDIKNDYVFALAIWQVPNDRDYPLRPGESIIIAQMADDQRKASLNPTSPVNLISAEFETFVAATTIIQDNPAINMHMAFWPSITPQWLTTVNGSAFALYNPGKQIEYGDRTNEVTPIGSTARHYKVPIGEVIDAVECIQYMTDINLKRVPILLDAGAASINGTYLVKGIYRKIKEVKEDGRIVYQDTNNSTEDFVVDKPVIRRNGAKIPSWNSWYKLDPEWSKWFQN